MWEFLAIQEFFEKRGREITITIDGSKYVNIEKTVISKIRKIL